MLFNRSHNTLADLPPQVLMEEAEELVILLWRQVVFESVAYAEGLDTEDIMLA